MRKRKTKVSTTETSPFQQYAMPLVRRVYPNLIAQQLISVQPMTTPSASAFYEKYVSPRFIKGDLVKNKISGNVGKILKIKGFTYYVAIQENKSGKALRWKKFNVVEPTPVDIAKYRMR